ncbi:hypothetical protein LVD15_01725 [Fulvivirga maritima]|uniref:hypothetical protein n=1 Tax=Fulvivirga maritima TaxID=2904247 RepID=UPI001F418883|nr:hypothetical protein [Fulvivirga maritima]UII27170.1 hypothetical protein LVD15_01725 [Fulvivirga maritima]
MLKILKYDLKKIEVHPIKLSLFILMPIILTSCIVFISHMHEIDDKPAEGEFASNLLLFILRISTSYFFLPAWIIITTGFEFKNGHISRIIPLLGRVFYLKSKLIHSVLIALLFTIVACISYIISFWISEFNYSYYNLNWQVLTQFFVVFLSYSLLLTFLIIVIKYPWQAFGWFIGIRLIENFLSILLTKLLKLQFSPLPLHLIDHLYSVEGDYPTYYNPFYNNDIIAPCAVILCLIIIGYASFRYFLHNDLPRLSE